MITRAASFTAPGGMLFRPGNFDPFPFKTSDLLTRLECHTPDFKCYNVS